MATKKQSGSFTAEERAAMKERAKELKSASGEQDVLDKIAEMPEDERAIAERIHAIAKEVAPQLAPKTWYGMPGWARDGKVAVFFQPAAKFKSRYSTLGFNDNAPIDDGDMWPTSFAVTRLTPEIERRIAELIRRAAG